MRLYSLPVMQTIGERIAHARRAKRLTQGKLAKACGVHQVTVARWETNKVQPEKIREIASALGVTAEWLLFGTEFSQTVSNVTTKIEILKELLHNLKSFETDLPKKRLVDFRLAWECAFVEMHEIEVSLLNLLVDTTLTEDMVKHSQSALMPKPPNISR